MQRTFAKQLVCPECQGVLLLATEATGDSVEDGALECVACQLSYPVVRGIPRFTGADTYASNFGDQWHRFSKTQLDSETGTSISLDRFASFTRFSRADLAGRLVLDAGCGAGRFAEISSSLGGKVVALDISSAIDVARSNLAGKPWIEFVQADLTKPPFVSGSFDLAYCLGVIQHTPKPTKAFASLASLVASGGRLAIDVYPKSYVTPFLPKYWVRVFSRRMKVRNAFALVDRIFPYAYPVSLLLGRVPIIGRKLRWALPIANYENVLPLSPKQLREWALLDTIDMWAPMHDHPQTESTLRRWFETAGYSGIEIERPGFIVGRGTKG